MIHYSNEQLATIIALPTITILLIWTIAIFHKNRKKWGPYDIPIVSVLVLSVIRNITILSYLLFVVLGSIDNFNVENCSVIVWIFNSVHTFQASSLTTIAVIGLFSVKLHKKQQNLKMFLTPTHIIYHLFCLTTLCACVGVAAILAQTERESLFEIIPPAFESGRCRFMPFNLDIKFNVFILVLHLFLAVISLFSFLVICCTFYRGKNVGFDYLKKSTSDLSDMSLGNTLKGDNNKGFYDTYTIHRAGQNADNNYYEQTHSQNNPHHQNTYCGNRDINWSSDLSNLSTTVSSTNSRKPCLAKSLREKEELEEENRTGLETIHPVLIVCYLFYHLPLIVLCIYPKLIHPWPVAGIALWLGLVQDLLIPIGLGIVDSRYCKWVSNVYRCSGKHVEEKLPQVGLDGKFRTFGTTSQPQSFEIPNVDRSKIFQAVEHRFPLTNGSLYTSIDGRLPVIHNYRRNKDIRGQRLPLEKQSSNVALHSSHLNRQEFEDITPKFSSCNNCELDLCPSHSNLHHLASASNYLNKQLNVHQQSQHLLQQNPTISQYDQNVVHPNHKQVPFGRKILPDRISHSQESLSVTQDNMRHFYDKNSDMGLNCIANNHVVKSSRNLVRLNKMRLSRSEDSLNNLQVREIVKTPRPNPLKLELLQPKQEVHKAKVEVNVQNGYSSSDDDYLTDANETVNNNNNDNDNYDSMSSKSCYSITTEANGDFEFFQSNEKLLNDAVSVISTDNNRISVPSNDEFFIINNVNNKPIMTSFKPINRPMTDCQTDLNKNFRITRSNSKRSLENFHAFIEVEQVDLKNNNGCNRSALQRSNSYITVEDRCRGRNKKLLRSDSKLSDCSHQFNNFKQKIKSVEYLPSSNASTIFIEDLNGHNQYWSRRSNTSSRNRKGAGSVPDLKKVFISEYI